MQKPESNVVRFPKTTAQAARLKKLVKGDELLEISITVTPDDNSYREQRTWRILLGLFQDCAYVLWSKGFTKQPGVPFVGKMRPSRLSRFLREALPFVAEERAEIYVGDERLRRQLSKVMKA